jgi:hypothetical protein
LSRRAKAHFFKFNNLHIMIILILFKGVIHYFFNHDNITAKYADNELASGIIKCMVYGHLELKARQCFRPFSVKLVLRF